MRMFKPRILQRNRNVPKLEGNHTPSSGRLQTTFEPNSKQIEPRPPHSNGLLLARSIWDAAVSLTYKARNVISFVSHRTLYRTVITRKHVVLDVCRKGAGTRLAVFAALLIECALT